MSFLAALLVAFAGFGAAALLLRRRDAVCWAELAACSLLLGTLATTLLWFAWALVLPGAVARVLTSAGAVALGALGVMAWRARRPRLEGGLPGVVLLAASVLAIAVAARSSFGWDGAFIWQVKANAVAAEGAVPRQYFHDDSRAWSHPIYPLLVPLSRAWLLGAHGAPHQSGAQAAGALMMVAAIGLLLGPGRRLGRGVGVLALLTIACTPLLLAGDGGALSGYADFPLAVYYLGAVLYLLPADDGRGARDWPMASALAAAMPWIKPEGTILWACWLVVAIATLGAPRWPRAAIAAVPGALVAIGWQLFSRLEHIETARVFLHPTPALLWERRGLAAEIARTCARIALDRTQWGLLWPLLLASLLLWPLWRWSAGRHGVLAAAVVLPLPPMVLSYFFSTWQPVSLHVESSFGRLLLQLGLPAAALVAAATASALRGVLPLQSRGVGGSTP